jgi:hypothetical protein
VNGPNYWKKKDGQGLYDLAEILRCGMIRRFSEALSLSRSVGWLASKPLSNQGGMVNGVGSTERMAMTDLVFPFWIVTQRRGVISLPVEPEDVRGFTAVFTTAEKAAAFMAERHETEWECRQVSRSMLVTFLEDVRVMVGTQGICLDPAKGKCGRKITFDEIERYGAKDAANG